MGLWAGSGSGHVVAGPVDGSGKEEGEGGDGDGDGDGRMSGLALAGTGR